MVFSTEDFTEEGINIIDALIKAIRDDISAIQLIIDTVSTENIDDLMLRLSALEVKVDNNTNVISSLIESLNGLSGEINKNTKQIILIKTELEAIKNDIDNLKECCNNVRNVLDEHDNRLTTNETEIETINREISRMKEDILGNARDIQTVATQISNIIASKQDKLTAGNGISIVDNVISSTGAGVVATYSNENLTLG